MSKVLQTPGLRAEFVQFAARMDQLAQMNTEIELISQFKKSLP